MQSSTSYTLMMAVSGSLCFGRMPHLQHMPDSLNEEDDCGSGFYADGTSINEPMCIILQEGQEACLMCPMVSCHACYCAG